MFNYTDSKEKMLRSKSTLFEKELCVICSETGGRLHRIEPRYFDEKMWKVLQVVSDSKLIAKVKLVNPDGAVANYTQCRLSCWVKLQDRGWTSSNDGVA